MSADVGDDVWNEDPTVHALEERASAGVGKAAGLFVPSGTMGNLVTLLTYCDTCALGIDVDTGAIPDFDEFYDCLVEGFDEVLALAAD